MRLIFVPLTCLALFVLASPIMAKDKKPAKEMDPQAMMEVYQKGLLTLQRLRSGGAQTIVVQRMTVSEGGQAIVGQVQTGEKNK